MGNNAKIRILICYIIISDLCPSLRVRNPRSETLPLNRVTIQEVFARKTKNFNFTVCKQEKSVRWY